MSSRPAPTEAVCVADIGLSAMRNYRLRSGIVSIGLAVILAHNRIGLIIVGVRSILRYRIIKRPRICSSRVIILANLITTPLAIYLVARICHPTRTHLDSIVADREISHALTIHKRRIVGFVDIVLIRIFLRLLCPLAVI